MTGRLLAGLLLALPAAAAADEAKLPDVAAFDRLVVDTLRDVHNRGADLYNTSKDFPGAFRMYEGALRTVRPLLTHRPVAQKMIEDGLAEADKESAPAQKAFKLHETIEAVRKHLKEVGARPDDKAKKPKDDAKSPEVAPPPHEKKAEVKPDEGKQPKDSAPVGAKTGGLSGQVRYKGQPLTAGEVTMVSLDLPKPRVFTAAIGKGGSYAFAERLPPGRYAVIVTGKTVPEKYATTTNSGITFDVKPGRSVHDIDLV